MQLAIFSDIHLEDKNSYGRLFSMSRLIVPDANNTIAIVAGDVSPKYREVVEFLSVLSNHYLKVIFTFGNHEFYHHDIQTVIQKTKENTAHLKNVYILNNEVIKLNNNTHLWGGTFWTDFNNSDNLAMLHAQRNMNDFNLIFEHPESDIIEPLDTVKYHKAALNSLKQTLDMLEPEQRLIVMTHHSPTYFGNAKQFINSPLNPAFSSNLDNFILANDDKIPLWVHGHKHNQIDGMIGNTRLVCHPMGYSYECERNYQPKVISI